MSLPLKCWLDRANEPDCDLPIQNLPYGAFDQGTERPRCGAAIGDAVVDLAVIGAEGVLDAGGPAPVFGGPGPNDFMALAPGAWTAVRARLTELLGAGGDPRLGPDAALRDHALVPRRDVRLELPFSVAGYTDFYACRQHAFNVGTMFRGPDNALPPNWLHIPIGYNGRRSW